MKRRAYLVILGLLAVTSLTWAAAPPSAMDIASKRLPPCTCGSNSDCAGGKMCVPRPCTEFGGFIEVCR
jgi:hypothetical protein